MPRTASVEAWVVCEANVEDEDFGVIHVFDFAARKLVAKLSLGSTDEKPRHLSQDGLIFIGDDRLVAAVDELQDTNLADPILRDTKSLLVEWSLSSGKRTELTTGDVPLYGQGRFAVSGARFAWCDMRFDPCAINVYDATSRAIVFSQPPTANRQARVGEYEFPDHVTFVADGTRCFQDKPLTLWNVDAGKPLWTGQRWERLYGYSPDTYFYTEERWLTSPFALSTFVVRDYKNGAQRFRLWRQYPLLDRGEFVIDHDQKVYDAIPQVDWPAIVSAQVLLLLPLGAAYWLIAARRRRRSR